MRTDRCAQPAHPFPPSATKRTTQVFVPSVSASAQPILEIGFGSLLVIAGLFIRAGVVLSNSWADRCIAGTLTTPQRRTPLVAVPVGGAAVLTGLAELSPASVRVVPILLLLACLALGGLIWVQEPAWSQPKSMRTARRPAFTGSRATTIVWVAVSADLVGTLTWVIPERRGKPVCIAALCAVRSRECLPRYQPSTTRPIVSVGGPDRTGTQSPCRASARPRYIAGCWPARPGSRVNLVARISG
jgi:hypothetical protein